MKAAFHESRTQTRETLRTGPESARRSSASFTQPMVVRTSACPARRIIFVRSSPASASHADAGVAARAEGALLAS